MVSGTVAEFAAKYHMSTSGMYSLIRKFNIQPLPGSPVRGALYSATDILRARQQRWRQYQCERQAKLLAGVAERSKSLPGFEGLETPRVGISIDEIKQGIGTRIILARQKRGWSQDTFAKKCGIHPSALCRIEQGKALLTPRSLARIAKGLNLSIERTKSELRGEGRAPCFDAIAQKDLPKYLGCCATTAKRILLASNIEPIAQHSKLERFYSKAEVTHAWEKHVMLSRDFRLRYRYFSTKMDKLPGYESFTGNWNFEVCLGIGVRLRSLRINRGLKVPEFATRGHISPYVLLQIENGEMELRAKYFAKIARTLEMTPDELASALSNHSNSAFSAIYELPIMISTKEVLQARRLKGLRLRSFRKARGFDLNTFSVAAHLSPHILTAYEHGKKEVEERHYVTMAHALQIPFLELKEALDGKGDKDILAGPKC